MLDHWVASTLSLLELFGVIRVIRVIWAFEVIYRCSAGR